MSRRQSVLPTQSPRSFEKPKILPLMPDFKSDSDDEEQQKAPCPRSFEKPKTLPLMPNFPSDSDYEEEEEISQTLPPQKPTKPNNP